MTDKELIHSCDEAVQREREALADVLRHLREIERRRLFSELNYKSLFDYCVRRLQYSEDQANRRISAMRLIKQLPEAEEKLEQGTLSLSNAALLQRMTYQSETPLSKEQKLGLLNQVENKSRREAERILCDAKTTLHIQVSDEVDEKFQMLRGLTAHKFKSVSELFDAMVDLALDEKHGLLPKKSSLAQKQRIMANAQKPANQSVNKNDRYEVEQSKATRTEAEQPALERLSSKQSRAGSSELGQPEAEHSNAEHSNAEHSNAEHSETVSVAAHAPSIQSISIIKCTRCGSYHAPQTEHVIPRAKGGSDEIQNLTLLCRNCNQRAAIREFGLKKMDQYLNH